MNSMKPFAEVTLVSETDSTKAAGIAVGTRGIIFGLPLRGRALCYFDNENYRRKAGRQTPEIAVEVNLDCVEETEENN